MTRNSHIDEQRLLTFAKRYLSEAFPNPQRIGCPSEDALKLAAVEPQKADETLSEHLTFCSPCFNRYMALLAELRQEQQAQRRPLWMEVFAWLKTSPMWIGSAVMVIGLVSIIAYFVALQREGPRPPVPSQPVLEPGPIALSPFTLDLRGLSPTRGSKSQKAGSQRRIRVPASLLDLTLTLPLGSEERFYRMTLSAGGQVFWSQSAPAHLHNGQMLVRIEADFRQVPPGSYNLEVESSAGIRLTQPLLLQAALPGSTQQE